MNTQSENESLEKENQEMKKQMHSLCSKIDSLEGHSRRNNLRFLGISVTSGEKWEDTEQKVRHFIKDTLGLPDFEHVEIERTHRVGNTNSEKKNRLSQSFLATKTVRPYSKNQGKFWTGIHNFPCARILLSEFNYTGVNCESD